MVSFRRESGQFRMPSYVLRVNNGADVVVPAMSGGTTIASKSGGSVPTDFGDVDELWFDINLRISAGLAEGGEIADHVHDMANHHHSGPSHTHQYDRADDVQTTSNDNSGAAGADPHGHTVVLTQTSAATSASGTGNTSGPNVADTGPAGAGSVTLMGPFVLHIVLVDSVGAQLEIAAVPFWYVRTGRSIRMTPTYPFGWRDPTGIFQPATVKVDVENLGASDITIDHVNTYVDIYARSLQRDSTV